MRKYGKYEKMPDGTRAKQPAAKSMLLQTYLTSLLCMVLCVAMFFGTTYAWFTSEVSNTGNEIYIGTLDVDLRMNGESLNNSGTKVFNNTICWEPGYTALRDLSVVNEGDLSFNYTLNFTAESVVDAAKYFDVWVYSNDDHTAYSKTEGETFAQMTEKEGWTPVGTLADVLKGKAVFSGSMAAVDENGNKVNTTHTYTIVLHMKESAENTTDTNGANSLMGKSVALNVKLTAYQKASEQDDLGSRYDQMVATEDELKAALQTGGTIALTGDITVEDTLTVPNGVSATLDLNGHKISKITKTPASLLTNNGTLTVEDSAADGTTGGGIAITFNGSVDNSIAVNAISNRGVLTVNGGEISNSGTGNQIGYAIDNYNGATLTVNGGKITANGSSYYDGIRLFCGSNETRVTVNDGEISSIWAQNPSANKATEVKGAVIVNGGNITTVYYENYTTVKVASNVTATVMPYGAGSDKTTYRTEDGYTVYSFLHE